ncbi:hypothetical protein I3843_15G146900 [Carya illinoinensis]|nr:hypothetical protein I3843_15G146900 [Carya illinoinensis]
MSTSSSMAFQLGASSSLSFSSSSIRRWTHDVFLSFRGEDVRQNFVSHLYHALHQRGINTYIDNNDLKRGEEISSELLKAIDGSMISIVVLSKNYSDSRWCLDELLKILACKEAVKQIVLPIFYDVDPSDVRHQKESFGEAFAKLRYKFKDEVKVTKWGAALEKVANLSGLELGDRNESEFIQDIIKWVDSKMVGRTHLKVAEYPVGIESRVRDIYARLNMGRSDIICMVGIFGTGGVGKTTVSKEIYNRISYQFEGSCFLKNVRETSKAGGLIQLQKTLLYDILGIRLKFHDTDKGINVIRQRLCSKRILLILDDVDDLVQRETLAGARDWFGLGSRIIITTRDQEILDNFEVDSKCEVMTLDDNEALELFSLYAFKKDEPLEDYMDLSKQVIKYAQGLPLALTVLGSDLKGRNIDQWKSALDKYRKIPHRKIQSVLQISYDNLEVSEKEMFLDIAVFFKGEPLAKIMEIFDSCGFDPVHGIQRLMEKCLITVGRYGDKYVWMHDLLQDMGQEIEREKSSKDPSKRNRLSFHEDVREVLEEDTGPNEIEGMVIALPEHDAEISLHPEAFRHMKRLRIFINRNARFSCAPNYLSDKLRVLDWYNYPSHYLPHNFQGKNLIVVRMYNSMIKELGDGFKPKVCTIIFINNFFSFFKVFSKLHSTLFSFLLQNLTTMDFRLSSYLIEIPDLSSSPNLKELTLRYCQRLVKVHDSVGSLEYLSKLDCEGCSKLRILPRSLKLRSLHSLGLRYCFSLRDFPEIECKMEFLLKLDLRFTAVKELPLSIGNLVGLVELSLNSCNLTGFPITLIQLQHLRNLNLCGWINALPNDSTTMEDEISNSRNGSNALQVSNLQISCSHSESNFFPLCSFFTMFNSSTSLHKLDLRETDFVSLPTNIKEFVTLSYLDLSYCHKLKEIAELPPNIRVVSVEGCQSLERFSEVSKILEFNESHIRSLKEIDMDDCNKMHENLWNDKVQNPILWKVGMYVCMCDLIFNSMLDSKLNL